MSICTRCTKLLEAYEEHHVFAMTLCGKCNRSFDVWYNNEKI